MKLVHKIINKMNSLGVFDCLGDKVYLKLMYKSRLNKKLNINTPITFNEKIQWLKLYDRKNIYTQMVDKYLVKDYVASIIGKEYIIPTYGVYEKFDEIDFDQLPEKFVIKCTHDSGGLIIVNDKNKFDIAKARNKIQRWLKKNYYYNGREWPYKNVKPRIIIEKYMEESNNNSIRDYKFFCFDGEPKIIYVSDNSHSTKQKIAFFDMNFKQLDIKRKDYNDYEILPMKPKKFEEMKKLASILSEDIPHVRVDFYEINGKIYFGELTFYTGSGFIPFESEQWDKKLGDMIKLPKIGS